MDPFDLIRSGRIKRYFRATRKLNVPNLVFHITQRAAGKEPLFLENTDYLSMLGLLKEISQNYLVRIYAFCLMPNHVHLLLSPRKENLYDSMRDLFSRYATGFNRKYERKGHLFGGPYRQAVCLDDGYLLAASLYIHLNPVKAGLVSDPLRYRWSSCRLYCEPVATKSFIDPDFILRLVSEDKDGKEIYRFLLKQASELESAHVLEQGGAIERFHSKLACVLPTVFKMVDQKKEVIRTSGMDLLSLAELGGDIEAVKTGSFDSKPESRKAKKYLIEQLIARGYKRAEIAERLGLSRKTIFNILKAPL